MTEEPFDAYRLQASTLLVREMWARTEPGLYWQRLNAGAHQVRRALNPLSTQGVVAAAEQLVGGARTMAQVALQSGDPRRIEAARSAATVVALQLEDLTGAPRAPLLWMRQRLYGIGQALNGVDHLLHRANFTGVMPGRDAAHPPPKPLEGAALIQAALDALSSEGTPDGAGVAAMARDVLRKHVLSGDPSAIRAIGPHLRAAAAVMAAAARLMIDAPQYETLRLTARLGELAANPDVDVPHWLYLGPPGAEEVALGLTDPARELAGLADAVRDLQTVAAGVSNPPEPIWIFSARRAVLAVAASCARELCASLTGPAAKETARMQAAVVENKVLAMRSHPPLGLALYDIEAEAAGLLRAVALLAPNPAERQALILAVHLQPGAGPPGMDRPHQALG